MSNTSSMPVLRGRGSALLSADREGLVLERADGRLTIPFGAIARVDAEARSVTVELRAPAGATPAVHRIEDVSAAAAVAFAHTVNALLPRSAEDVDGAALVEVRAFTRTWVETYRGKVGRVLLWLLGGILVLAVITAVVGDEKTAVAGAVFMMPFGGMALVGLWLGAVCIGPWWRETRLRRHGVTVVAARSADGAGAYEYTDATGTTRVLIHPGTAPSIQVSYAPRNPSDVLVLQEPSTRFLDITLGPCFLLGGLAALAATIGLSVVTILGIPLS
ncbi:hypothetical protein ACFYOG_33775 [Streptomyces sp. NPDC007818]|uniref:hypothetical protein n=1 Tax=Streptomyces sp. NPDC007818 TaxID=3364780 RepID=UPI0036BED621